LLTMTARSSDWWCRRRKKSFDAEGPPTSTTWAAMCFESGSALARYGKTDNGPHSHDDQTREWRDVSLTSGRTRVVPSESARRPSMEHGSTVYGPYPWRCAGHRHTAWAQSAGAANLVCRRWHPTYAHARARGFRGPRSSVSGSSSSSGAHADLRHFGFGFAPLPCDEYAALAGCADVGRLPLIF